MSELEKCMESLISVFHRYAAGDGDKATLTKKELKQLLEKEFSTFLSAQKSPDIVDKLMMDLDQNNDKKVDFGEFMVFVVGLSTACEAFHRAQQNKGKKL